MAARNVNHHVRVEHDAREQHDHQDDRQFRQMAHKKPSPFVLRLRRGRLCVR